MPHGLLRYQMAYFVIKCALSGIIIAVVSEVAKRSPSLGALIVSLPLVSLLVAALVQWRVYAYIRSNVIRTTSVPIPHIHRGIAARKRPADWVPC